MLGILRIFDEGIININALKNDSNPFYTEYMVLNRNHAKALPLAAYGDGMKKAMLYQAQLSGRVMVFAVG